MLPVQLGLVSEVQDPAADCFPTSVGELDKESSG